MTIPNGFVIYRGPSLLNGAPIVVVLLTRSQNAKTGDCAQTYILADHGDRPVAAIRNGSDASVCGDCQHRPVNAATCYVVVRQGTTNVWDTLQRGAYEDLSRFPDIAGEMIRGRMVRLGTYGDPAAVPVEVWRELTAPAAGWVGYCVAPETKVLTSDLRWVRAGDVRVGDALTAFDEFPVGAGRYWRTAVVTAAERVLRPCYAVHMRDGTTLIASADHPWLVLKGGHHAWMTTEKLEAGARPTQVVKLIEPWGDPIHSWDAGYLAAAFDGEGWIGKGGRQRRGHMGHLGFTQLDNAMATTVCAALDIYHFKHRKHRSGEKVPQYNLLGGIREVIRFLGQMRPARLLSKFDPNHCGRLTTLKHVPVDSIRFVGMREVAGLTTTTGTFVAEGFASHNTHQWRQPLAQPLRALCMASVDSPSEHDLARAMGWRPFRVRLASEPLRRNEAICPASEEGGRKLTCATCGFCDGAGRGRRGGVAIVLHGNHPDNRAARFIEQRPIAHEVSA